MLRLYMAQKLLLLLDGCGRALAGRTPSVRAAWFADSPMRLLQRLSDPC